MSAGNPTHIIAEAIEDHDGSPIVSDELAAYVVSKLTDAGYLIVKLPKVVGECENKYPLSDPPLLCQRVSGHRGGHEALDASCDRFRWPNLAATEGGING